MSVVGSRMEWAAGMAVPLESDEALLLKRPMGILGGAALAVEMSLMPTATGSEQTGAVNGMPGLSYTGHGETTRITLIRTETDGQTYAIGNLTKAPDRGLYDHDNARVGHMEVNGTLTLDRAAITEKTEKDNACRSSDPSERMIRNAALPEALQSSFQKARNTVFENDPQLKKAGLEPFGKVESDCAKWQAHHLIPIKQIEEFKDVFIAAARDKSAGKGWSADEKNNLMGLPYNKAAQGRLEAAGSPRPLHDSAHQTNYSARVQRDMTNIRRDLVRSRLPLGSLEYNQRAHRLVEAVQTDLRAYVESLRMGRLTMADPAHVEWRGSIRVAAAETGVRSLDQLGGSPAPYPAAATDSRGTPQQRHVEQDAQSDDRAYWRSVAQSTTVPGHKRSPIDDARVSDHAVWQRLAASAPHSVEQVPQQGIRLRC